MSARSARGRKGSGSRTEKSKKNCETRCLIDWKKVSSAASERESVVCKKSISEYRLSQFHMSVCVFFVK